MAVSFNSIIADVMSQLNALAATTAAAAETAYTNAASGTIASVSTDWPVAQIKEAILDAEYEVIKEICFNPAHPERADFSKTSSAITTGSALPSAASDSTPFLGPFSEVKDSTSNAVLTKRPLQVVKWASENAGSMFVVTPAIYALDGHIIRFVTANNVVIVGPGAARATFTGNIRCRDYHRPAIVAGSLVKLLPKEGAWAEAMNEQAQIYSSYIQSIREVGQEIVNPSPSQT